MAVDDTANPKYGKFGFRCGNWHNSKGLFFGQKIVVVVLVDIKRDFALPLSYVVATKKEDPNYKSGLDHAIDLLQQSTESRFSDLPIVCDSWFDSSEFMKKVMELGLIFVGEIKASRMVRGNPGQRVNWEKSADFFKEMDREKISTRCDRREIQEGTKQPKSIASSVMHIKNL